MIVLISVLLTALLCLYLAHEKSLSGAACTAVSGLIGGGMGNLLDRFFFGGVTDYIKLLFIRFPIFNFADMCVSASVVALILLLLLNTKQKKRRNFHG
ncbi:MAG: signal peptidase II [Christensenellales bacterium]